ncbi:hypothetical protein [Modestobacter sp. SYSU DS0290]
MAAARWRIVAALLAAPPVAACSAPAADGVATLVKADGWSPSLDRGDFGGYHTVLEIAHDEATAAAAWATVVPDDLPSAGGEPREPGRYGALEDVDFAEQVLVVLSGGQSGVCPGWLGDVSVADGEVNLEERRHVPGNGCTEEYAPYRLVLAVDRDSVPAADALPTERVLVDGRDLPALVTSYPAG